MEISARINSNREAPHDGDSDGKPIEGLLAGRDAGAEARNYEVARAHLSRSTAAAAVLRAPHARGTRTTSSFTRRWVARLVL